MGSSPVKFRDTYGSWVNGKELILPGHPSFDVENPATGEHLCSVQSADTKIVDDAINIAHDTFHSGVWSKSDVRERAKVLNEMARLLRENIDDMAEMEVAQTGRAVREMKAQLGRLPEWFEYVNMLVMLYL